MKKFYFYSEEQRNDIVKNFFEGDVYSTEPFAKCWVNDEFSPEEKEDLFAKIEQNVMENHSNCIYFKGLMEEYANHMAEALPWYEKAADLGHHEAIYRIGMYHAFRENGDAAMDCYEKAAALGNGKASYSLGFLYQYGCNVPHDYQKAFDYYLQAFEENLGLYELGHFYEQGLGTEVDLKKAASYYHAYLEEWINYHPYLIGYVPLMACDGVDSFCQEANMGMGRCMLALQNDNTYSWYDVAADYFARAYDLGSKEAAYYLGYCHLFGIQIDADPEYGLSYIEEAAGAGVEEAVKFMTAKYAQDEYLETLKNNKAVTEEQRQKEALLRLSILEEKGLDKDAKELFAKTGTPGIGFDDSMGVTTFAPEYVADYALIKKEIDKFHARGNTVYYVQYSLTFMGTMVSLFYVSSHPEEWGEDRIGLLKERPMVAVSNLSSGYMELGSIRYSIEKESMERIF